MVLSIGHIKNEFSEEFRLTPTVDVFIQNTFVLYRETRFQAMAYSDVRCLDNGCIKLSFTLEKELDLALLHIDWLAYCACVSLGCFIEDSILSDV